MINYHEDPTSVSFSIILTPMLGHIYVHWAQHRVTASSHLPVVTVVVSCRLYTLVYFRIGLVLAAEA